MILFIGKRRFLNYLYSERARIDKEYLKELDKIEKLDFDLDTKMKMIREAFCETQGKNDAINDMINKLM